MRLRRVKLKNVCQYRDVAVEFGAGDTVAVIGPNGSGKSNLVNATYASLTNDWTRLSGGKSANVRYGSKGPAHAAVDFVHDDVECELVRDLKGKSSYLMVGSQERVTGEDAITSRLFDLLQVKDQKVLNDYVFIQQSVAHAFLENTENKRHKAMQHLFDLAKFEKIAEIFKDETKRYVPSTVDAEINDLQLWLVSASRRRLSLSSELDQYPEMDLSNDLSVVQEWNEQQARGKAVAEANSRRTACLQRIAEADKTIEKLEGKLSTLDVFISKYEDAYNQQQQVRENNKRREAAVRELDELDSKLQDVETQLQAAAKDRPAESRESLQESLESVSGSLSQCRAALSLIASGQADCPTCGTEVSELDKDEISSRVSDLTAQQDRLRKQIKTLQTVSNLESLQQKLKEQKASLAKFVPDLKTSVMTEEQQEKFRESTKCYKQIELDLASARGARVSERKQLKLLESTLQEDISSSVSAQDYERARANINSHRLTSETRQQLVTSIAVLQSQIAENSKKLTELKKTKQRHVQEKEWFERCCQMVDIFRDLPKIITQHHLHTIEQRMAPIIAAFDATFRVAASDGLELVASFDDGSQQPCSRLSGGQKDVLGLAYYFAVNLMYASSVRLIVMDEPTRFMDDSYVSKMLDVLAGMKDVVAKYAVQCLVVTHEKRLASVFDQVIDVGDLQ